MGLWPGESYFERPLQLRRPSTRRCCRSCGDRRLATSRASSSDGRLPASSPQPQATMKIICAGSERRGPGLHRPVCRLQLRASARASTRRPPSPPVNALLAAAKAKTGRDVALLHPLHDHRRRDRRGGRWPSGSSTRTAPTRRRCLAGRPGRAPTPGRHRDTNVRQLAARSRRSTSTWARWSAPTQRSRACSTRWPPCRAPAGVLLTFDDFVKGAEIFGERSSR